MRSRLSPLTSALLLLAVLIAPSLAWATDEPGEYDVVVVGGGMGGLSSGALLSSYGFRVLLLEQHHKVGGCTSSFTRGEFAFDAALHEMLGGAPGTALGDLLHEAGVDDKIELIPIPELYRSIFPGVDFVMPGGRDAAIEALCEAWPEECPGIIAFHEEMRAVAEQTSGLADMQRRSSLSKILIPFQAPAVVRNLRGTTGELLDRYFQDERLKAVVAQLWVYYGPPPDELWPIIFFSANHNYLTQGAYHIRGSSQALADAYAERIVELGGAVRTGTRVGSIDVVAGRVVGVTTQAGEHIPARYVVSNADPYQTFHTLVGREHLPEALLRKLERMEPSNGLVGVYLGLDVEPSLWGIDDHEIFYNTTLDAERAYRSMMDGSYDEASITLTFYSNLGDDFYAPPGKSVLVLHSYADIASWPEDREAYLAEKERVAARLIELASRQLPGLAQHIEVMEVATPTTLRSYTLAKAGTPYGFDATPEQGLCLPNTTPIDGLFMANAWTSPGQGVSTAQLSGREAARQVLERERARGLIDRETVQAILDRLPVERLREVVQGAEAMVGFTNSSDVASDPDALQPVIDSTTGATTRYLPVTFASHDDHVEQYGLACEACHHTLDGLAVQPQPCSACHDQRGSTVDLSDASHESCRGCHREVLQRDPESLAPVDCMACHRERD
jgi:all-trans-retinol 13,14-reductase